MGNQTPPEAETHSPPSRSSSPPPSRSGSLPPRTSRAGRRLRRHRHGVRFSLRLHGPAAPPPQRRARCPSSSLTRRSRRPVSSCAPACGGTRASGRRCCRGAPAEGLRERAEGLGRVGVAMFDGLGRTGRRRKRWWKRGGRRSGDDVEKRRVEFKGKGKVWRETKDHTLTFEYRRCAASTSFGPPTPTSVWYPIANSALPSPVRAACAEVKSAQGKRCSPTPQHAIRDHTTRMTTPARNRDHPHAK